MSLADCVYTYPHPAHRDSIIDCPGVPFPVYDQPDSDPFAVQQMLDEAARAFAVARPGAERIEVISGMLAAWYAAWPASAVTDEHEGIARHLAALIDEAEARAVACPCLPGAPAHRHGVGGYSTSGERAAEALHVIAFAGDGTWSLEHPAAEREAEAAAGYTRPSVQFWDCQVCRLAEQQVTSEMARLLGDWRYECWANDLGDMFLLGDRVDPAEGGCERCAAQLICPTHDDPRRSEG